MAVGLAPLRRARADSDDRAGGAGAAGRGCGGAGRGDCRASRAAEAIKNIRETLCYNNKRPPEFLKIGADVRRFFNYALEHCRYCGIQ